MIKAAKIISKKYKGAQNEAHIKNPSIEDFKMFKNETIIDLEPNKSEILKEYNIDTSAGHPTSEGDDIVRAYTKDKYKNQEIKNS